MNQTLIPIGKRRIYIQSEAGKSRNAGLDEDGIYAALKKFCVEHCEDGKNYLDSELRNLAKEAVAFADSLPLNFGYERTEHAYSEFLPLPLLQHRVEQGIRNALQRPKTKGALLKFSGADRYQSGWQVFDQTFNRMREHGDILSLGCCSAKGREMFALTTSPEAAQNEVARRWNEEAVQSRQSSIRDGVL